MQTREVQYNAEVPCTWCNGRGCLVCVEARSKRAKEIVLHIRCEAEELDGVLAKVNGAVLRTTQVLVYATYAAGTRRRDEDEASDPLSPASDTSDPPEILAMRREVDDLKQRTQTGFVLDRIADIERKLAAHQAGVERLKALFAAEAPPDEPQPPAWLIKKKPRKRRPIDTARPVS